MIGASAALSAMIGSSGATACIMTPLRAVTSSLWMDDIDG